MAYLPDLARLEWAAHRCYGAADGRRWDRSTLAAVDLRDQGSIVFDWAPGPAVIGSDHPIARIWTIHQPDYAGEFSVDWGAGETALVARDGFIVTVSALGAGEAAFMAHALEGAGLGDAAAQALRVDPAFDLGALLGRAIDANLICGFALAQGKQESTSP